jgi:hypothetical protein
MSFIARNLSTAAGLSIVLLAAASPAPARAQSELRTEFTGWVQATGATGAGRSGRLDGNLQLRAFDYTATGIEYGLQLAEGSARPRENQAMLYMQAGWGRLQLGDQPGPTAALLPRAPRVGLGQVDGEGAFFGAGAGRVLPAALEDDVAPRLSYVSPAFVGVQLGLGLTARRGDPWIRAPRNKVQGRFPRPVADGGRSRSLGEAVLTGTRQIGETELRLGASYAGGAAGQDWGLGTDLAWKSWRIGGGWSPGNPNVGLSWNEAPWGAALSYARSERGDTVGVGASWAARRWLELNADLVHADDTRLLVATRLSF